MLQPMNQCWYVTVHLYCVFCYLVFCEFEETYSDMRPSLVAQTVENPLAMPDICVWSLGQEDPLEKGMLPNPVFLPREFHGQRSLVGYSPRGHKRAVHYWVADTFTFPSDMHPSLLRHAEYFHCPEDPLCSPSSSLLTLQPTSATTLCILNNSLY